MLKRHSHQRTRKTAPALGFFNSRDHHVQEWMAWLNAQLCQRSCLLVPPPFGASSIPILYCQDTVIPASSQSRLGREHKENLDGSGPRSSFFLDLTAAHRISPPGAHNTTMNQGHSVGERDRLSPPWTGPNACFWNKRSSTFKFQNSLSCLVHS